MYTPVERLVGALRDVIEAENWYKKQRDDATGYEASYYLERDADKVERAYAELEEKLDAVLLERLPRLLEQLQSSQDNE